MASHCRAWRSSGRSGPQPGLASLCTSLATQLTLKGVLPSRFLRSSASSAKPAPYANHCLTISPCFLVSLGLETSVPTTCPSKLYMKIIDGKEKGRALQLPTRDPLAFRGIGDVPFSQPLVCLVFPSWPRPGLHGPKRPCSGARAVTLAPLAWAPQGNLIQLGQGIPAPSSACSSQTRGVLNAPARLAGRESGWLRRLQWRPLLSLLSSLSQCCLPSSSGPISHSDLLKVPWSPLVTSGTAHVGTCSPSGICASVQSLSLGVFPGEEAMWRHCGMGLAHSV